MAIPVLSTRPLRTMRRTLTVLALAFALLPGGCTSHPGAHTEVVTDEAGPSTLPPHPDPHADDRPIDPIAPNDTTMEDASKPDPCAEDKGIYGADGTPLPPVPALKTRISDFTGVLTDDCKADLTSRLAALEQDTGAQVAVLLVYTTDGTDIESYTNNVFHQAALGRKGIDDGVLFVVALQDKHARIEVGYGLEGTIPDAVAGDMLRNDLQPNFRNGHYNAGISAVVADLSARVRVAQLAQPAARPRRATGLAFLLAMILLSAVLGGVGAALNLAWPWRILLPPAVTALCTLAAVPLHLTPGYGTIIALIPISVATSLLGVPFVRSTRLALQWLAFVAVAALALCILTAILRHSSTAPDGSLDGWYFAALAGGFFLGSLLFLIVKVLRSGVVHRVRAYPSSNDRGSDSSSSAPSSSSDSSFSSSSSDSSSDSFSGGGGDSGGGGASSSW